MAGETDDPEDAAARLEAALERIAQPHRAASGRRCAAPTAGVQAMQRPNHRSEPPVEEIAARLDGLIDRLRAALTTSSGGRPG